MGESKVHLNGWMDDYLTNQNRFVWTPYMAFMKEQRETNEHLVIVVNRLEQVCGRLLDIVSRQQNSHRNRYFQLRDRIWEVQEKLHSDSVKQDTIREELGKQGEAVFRLRKSLQNHRMSMRQFTVNQFDDMHVILDMLDRIESDNAKVIGKLEAQEIQQLQEAESVEKSIEKILHAKKSIGRLLSKLPPTYPIQQIVVEGSVIPVINLLNVDEKKGFAFFTADTGVVTVAIDKLDAIQW
ncbi:hypothetical protein QTL97_03830 [Sporosarcina thermotolerans]|uniref:Uncharacterized protein n=1 Tax=Sporosarcina thermotolerans TaxID=633404 RepID=A0AAW9A4N0_9BACL|nr:hypothetical protein [Sporosarcina thermotolerans]MDW0116052.1 hypothetical protein [Sporosarcina thermotolerans]WHT48023.1 hypothetical protein QNH10_18570 [Sporosarcina thermotolerans]